MINAAIALEILNVTLKVSAKVQEILAAAQQEERDVTSDELSFLKMRNDELEQKIINS